ncbi:MAG: hypothetical protein EHM48_00145 [Planctomycetaceae bacterium]|nr:MAG: hypothetical protein EHM48_00145 [Planctomycetaceae bacterium]
MTTTEIVAVVGAIGAVLGSIAASVIAWRRIPAEIRRMSAETAKINREAMNGSGKARAETRVITEQADQLQFSTMCNLIEALRNDIKELRARIDTLEKLRTGLERELAEVKARALVSDALAAKSSKDMADAMQRLEDTSREFARSRNEFSSVRDRDRTSLRVLSAIVLKLVAQLELLGKSPALTPDELGVLRRLTENDRGSET